MGEHDISALIAWCGTFAENESHISIFMLCRPVVFVNARSCFNSCRADSPGETRNTVRCASRLRSIAGHVDLEARGARLAHGEMAPRKSLRPASGRWPPRCRQSTTGTSSAAGRGSGALSAPQREPSGQDGVGYRFRCSQYALAAINDRCELFALGADWAESVLICRANSAAVIEIPLKYRNAAISFFVLGVRNDGNFLPFRP